MAICLIKRFTKRFCDKNDFQIISNNFRKEREKCVKKN